MKVAIVLLSSLALVAPQRRYPSGGSGFGGGPGFGGGAGFGSGGGRYPGSGGGRPIVFPGQAGGSGGNKGTGGHVHGDGHGHGSVGVGSGGIIGGGGSIGGISRFPKPDLTFAPDPINTQACRRNGRNDLVDFEYNGHVYHFSWCADSQTRFTWQAARNYCERLGGGWYPVAVDDRAEDNAIINILAEHRSPWIWTGATRQKNSDVWTYTDGKTARYFNWGQTGSLNRPQPDNAEDNNELCLAYLNQFYEGDLITFHDIGCHHEKPVICEHNSGGRGQVPQYG